MARYPLKLSMLKPSVINNRLPCLTSLENDSILHSYRQERLKLLIKRDSTLSSTSTLPTVKDTFCQQMKVSSWNHLRIGVEKRRKPYRCRFRSTSCRLLMPKIRATRVTKSSWNPHSFTHPYADRTALTRRTSLPKKRSI